MERPITPVPIQPRRVLDGLVSSGAEVAMVRRGLEETARRKEELRREFGRLSKEERSESSRILL